MTDKELKRLTRSELLELLILQSKRVDELEKSLKDLENTLQEEKANRKITIEEVGSIAEAALRLNGIFETAQSAADQYLENIITKCEEKERLTEETCEKQLEECALRCKRMEAETQNRCKELVECAREQVVSWKQE